MSKFKTLQDDGFIAVSDTLLRWYENLGGTAPNGRPESPQRAMSQPVKSDTRTDDGFFGPSQTVPCAPLLPSGVRNSNVTFEKQQIQTNGGKVLQVGYISAGKDVFIG